MNNEVTTTGAVKAVGLMFLLVNLFGEHWTLIFLSGVGGVLGVTFGLMYRVGMTRGKILGTYGMGALIAVIASPYLTEASPWPAKTFLYGIPVAGLFIGAGIAVAPLFLDRFGLKRAASGEEEKKEVANASN